NVGRHLAPDEKCVFMVGGRKGIGVEILEPSRFFPERTMAQSGMKVPIGPPKSPAASWPGCNRAQRAIAGDAAGERLAACWPAAFRPSHEAGRFHPAAECFR